MNPNSCYFKLRIVFAVIGVFVGLSIAITFSCVYKNIHTAVWGGVSGVLAAVTLYLHIRFIKDKWLNKPKCLLTFTCLGAFLQIGCIAAFVTYLVIAVNEGQKLTPYGPRAFYLACVWAGMSWKWAFMMTTYSSGYRRFLSCPLSRETERLIHNEEA